QAHLTSCSRERRAALHNR
uniref:GATA-2 protein n=1 Tax=Xenopus laevis TaxID=8355 RepID=Q7LZS3_XENLA